MNIVSLFQRFRGFSSVGSMLNFKNSRLKLAMPQDKVGEVYLIGAGPGDPELLTVKALKLLNQADVVLYDWLVSDELMAMLPSNVQKVFVGKKAGKHSMAQQNICDLIVYFASQGKKVARLKGGDPAVFGRLSEECEALQNANIPFAIVPGITAASGLSAYTGTPLTDRKQAHSLRFLTARLKDEKAEADWNAISVDESGALKETLVFYMGLAKIQGICTRLIERGLSKDTPVMVVEQATTPRQKVLQATLSDAMNKVVEANLCGPALIVVSPVCANPFDVNLSLLHREAAHV